MNNNTYMAIGEIVEFKIHKLEDDARSASMELKVLDEYFIFGGPDLFSSIPGAGVDLLGHFINRCFQVSAVVHERDLEGHLLKVAIEEDLVIGIASLTSDDFFYPAVEFALL